MIATYFLNADGKHISADEFLHNLFGELPEFFKNEEELRKIWANPSTRKTFLEKISEIGYGKEELDSLQKLIGAEKSDLYDVLAYVSFAIPPISREERAAQTKQFIFKGVDAKQGEFLDFVLAQYIAHGVQELDEDKLPALLNLKYHAITDAERSLGSVNRIRTTFLDFQKKLYSHVSLN